MIESSRANKDIRHLIVCTGGAQDYLIKAHMYGADVYLSGEISERTTHEARELGVHISAGHHATERYGVQALGEKIRRELGVEVCFSMITPSLIKGADREIRVITRRFKRICHPYLPKFRAGFLHEFSGERD